MVINRWSGLHTADIDSGEESLYYNEYIGQDIDDEQEDVIAAVISYHAPRN